MYYWCYQEFARRVERRCRSDGAELGDDGRGEGATRGQDVVAAGGVVVHVTSPQRQVPGGRARPGEGCPGGRLLTLLAVRGGEHALRLHATHRGYQGIAESLRSTRWVGAGRESQPMSTADRVRCAVLVGCWECPGREGGGWGGGGKRGSAREGV